MRCGSNKNNQQSGSRNSGTQITSKTLWKGKEGHLGVENPNPVQRPGQLHFQDFKGNKYLYNIKNNTFKDVPNKINKLLNDPNFYNMIQIGLRYLGIE